MLQNLLGTLHDITVNKDYVDLKVDTDTFEQHCLFSVHSKVFDSGCFVLSS
jgi:hypothetical protein